MAVIQVHGLTKRFGSVLAVDRLSFEVERGTVVGFLGPNGAGKTITLRALLGLVRPTGGTATINGKAYTELPDPTRNVGAVLEAPSFYPSRRARNHLRVQAMAGGIQAARVEAVLDLVGLQQVAGRRVGGFSLGMRQRLDIATAMLGDPEVLVLDEPATGLDPEGRLVAQSSLEELTAGARRVVRVRTPRAHELANALHHGGVRVERVAADRLEVTGTTSERVGMLAAQLGIPILESTTSAANLEDVFFQLTATTDQEEPR
jgi:ABC-2 type transport system ATP-binding protein